MRTSRDLRRRHGERRGGHPPRNPRLGRRRRITAVLDTGFTGFLTLPGHIVDELQLPSFGNQDVTLADGSETSMDMHLARVLWHEGREHEVLILRAEGGLLLGMELLHGNRVVLDVIEDGEVEIEPLA